jgi:hypothetical protein
VRSVLSGAGALYVIFVSGSVVICCCGSSCASFPAFSGSFGVSFVSASFGCSVVCSCGFSGSFTVLTSFAAWFGKKNVFNKEVIRKDGSKTWYVNREKITFPKDKTWRKYILEKRLEIACGEAPYITSRYDTTTGEFIPVEKRIGILDRKLRVINENVDNSGKWLLAAQDAYKSTYGFEWQGDSLLLAREAMLMTFIENYALKFGKEPLPKSIKFIAYIISWNIWQMDGLKGIVPESCETTLKIGENLFGEKFTNKIECEGCQKNDLKKHNGIYCLINDWYSKDKSSGKKGLKIKFVDLLNKL